MYKMLIIFTIVTFTSGCTTQLLQIAPLKEIIEVPIDTTNLIDAEIGDVILSKSSYNRYPAIRLHKMVKAGGGLLIECTVPKQDLVANFEDKKWIYYSAQNVTDYDFLIGSSNVMGGIKIKKSPTKNNNDAVYCRTNFITLYPQNDYPINYTEIMHREKLANEPSSSIFYNGKSDTKLFFLYYHPDANGNELKSIIEHDLSVSNKFSVGGAEILIVSSNSTSIKYRVLNKFSNNAHLLE